MIKDKAPTPYGKHKEDVEWLDTVKQDKITYTLEWTNPNINDDFEPQSVQLTTGYFWYYDFLIILDEKNRSTVISCNTDLTGGLDIDFTMSNMEGEHNAANRIGRIINVDEIYFENNYTDTSSVVENHWNKPYKIYGVKISKRNNLKCFIRLEGLTSSRGNVINFLPGQVVSFTLSANADLGMLLPDEIHCSYNIRSSLTYNPNTGVVSFVAPVDDCCYIDATNYFYIEGPTVFSWNSEGDVSKVKFQRSSNAIGWTDLPKGTNISVSSGQKIYIKNRSKNFAEIGDGNDITFHFSSGTPKVGGMLASLINFRTNDLNNISFSKLFYYSDYLVDASKLVIYVKGGQVPRYTDMFNYCDALKKGPIIPNYPDLENTPKFKRFYQDCSALEEIKFRYNGPFTKKVGLTTYYHFEDWVDGIPSTGTFYYNGTETKRGTDYIPTGWTITPF